MASKETGNSHKKPEGHTRIQTARLGASPTALQLDPKRIIFNYSNHNLTNTETQALLVGLDFNFPIRRINFFKCFPRFEQLYDTLHKLDICNVVTHSVDISKD